MKGVKLVAKMGYKIEETLLIEPAKEPSKKWRNRYSSREIAPYSDGLIRGPGEYDGDGIYPSKEIAENTTFTEGPMAPEYALWRETYGVEYLGAFPVEE